MSAAETPHERVTMRGAASEAAWCVRGALYHLRAPLRRLPLCRFGVHEWCNCCSPFYCIRCDAEGHD